MDSSNTLRNYFLVCWMLNFILFIFIARYLLYNTVLVSAIHQRESATGICIYKSVCIYRYVYILGFRCLSCKESTYNAGDLGLIPGLGRSPGEGNGYSLQYSGLESSMDCVVHGVAKSQTQLSDFHLHMHHMYWDGCEEDREADSTRCWWGSDAVGTDSILWGYAHSPPDPHS